MPNGNMSFVAHEACRGRSRNPSRMTLTTMWEIVDTFDEFLRYWDSACSEDLVHQVERWRSSYMAAYPELLQKQIDSYEGYNLDWREVAREKVFPRLAEYLPLMREGRKNLLKVCGSVYEKGAEGLQFDFDVTFVIYVGVGCGAGWATQYAGRPACLFGLENIAECRWHTQELLEGLTAHELGHLAHVTWRNERERFVEFLKDRLFLLYEEGFGQRCEHLILERESWHQAQDEQWLTWCRQHHAWLAKEYLRRVDADVPVNDFFGSWLDIQGKRQTGYFLGHELTRWLEQHHGMREIATLPFEEVRKRTERYLRLAGEDSA